jgi:D-arabinose 1-dehydrogenase-like Zn-dependent alcohol dehydrogenase
MALTADVKIRCTIKTINFEQINKYLDLMRNSEVVGRAVVKY